MSSDERVPSDDQVRGRYCDGTYRQTGHTTDGSDFDAWLARVRRDAVRQFIEACKVKRDEPGFLLPANYWQDIDAAIRVAESYVKNCPEETP